jgi:hypothetical protein
MGPWEATPSNSPETPHGTDRLRPKAVEALQSAITRHARGASRPDYAAPGKAKMLGPVTTKGHGTVTAEPKAHTTRERPSASRRGKTALVGGKTAAQDAAVERQTSYTSAAGIRRECAG